jgi:hypothetical protein
MARVLHTTVRLSIDRSSREAQGRMEITENTRKRTANPLSRENIASPMACPFAGTPFKTVCRAAVRGVMIPG